MIEVASPTMTQEYLDFLKGVQPAMMSDAQALREMRATHVKTSA